MKRKFLMYVIPSVSAMWIYSLYTMASGIFVAKGINEIALASLSISMPFINGVFALAILFAVGTSTIASINLGNKKTDKASEIFSMNSVILTVISITATAAVLINLDRISYFLGATDKTIVYVRDYLRLMSLYSVFAVLTYYFEVLVKTDGHPQLATIGVGISAVTNISLVYLFVIRMNLGIKGAALASGLSYGASTIFYLVHFIKGNSKLKFVSFKLDLSLIKRTLRLGLADFITEFSSGFITFMFNWTIIRNIGEIGVITYTVIVYLNSFVNMTMAGISQGAQPLASYYYGKDEKKSYSYIFKTSVKTVALVSLAVYAVCMIFAEKIAGIYIRSEETELLQYSVRALRTFAPTYLLAGFNIIFVGFYSAIEKPVYSMIISIGRGLVVMSASLMLMTELVGPNGIWMSSVVSEVVCLAGATLIFIKLHCDDMFSGIFERQLRVKN
ncbi:MAG: MATE family efflux transporter [Sedimentibacter sp.]|uniref:MATE family efflux transporter n=1 Tax=Sedimentibacter sp. TaxID=1960295 RepID=UPI0031594FE0